MSTTTARVWADRVRAAVSPVPATTGRAFRRHRTGETAEGTAARLRSWIYCDVHTGPDVEHRGGGADPARERRVVAALPTGTYRARGWTVAPEPAPDGEGLVVERDGVALLVAAGEVAPAAPGDVVEVPLPRTRPRALPGWAAFVSPTGPGADAAARVYLHLRSEAALPRLVAALDGAPVRWRAKVSTAPGPATRPDAAVVYCAPADLPALAGRLVPALRDALHDPVPGFSQRLAPGLAVSVNPAEFGAGSFGAGAAHLAAQALLTGSDLAAALSRCCVPLPGGLSPRPVRS